MSNSDCSSEPTRNGDGVRRLIIVCMKAHVVGKEGCRGFFSQQKLSSNPMQRGASVIYSTMRTVSSTPRAQIPFKVKRTAADNIPVYTIKRFNKNLIFTQVRKIRGDAKVIKDELTRICGTPARIIADGVIELNGNHRSVIKQWLASNGF